MENYPTEHLSKHRNEDLGCKIRWVFPYAKCPLWERKHEFLVKLLGKEPKLRSSQPDLRKGTTF